nr:unnamed protein product [Callosobruchus analis]
MFEPSAKLRSPPQWPSGSGRTAQGRPFQVQNAIFCAAATNAGR